MTATQEIIEKFKLSDKDVGSSPVQIALLTDRILHLQKHLTVNKKDQPTKRSLLKLVARRKRLQKYYKAKNPAAYEELKQSLGIRN